MKPPSTSALERPGNEKYVALDVLRVACTFGVVFLHVFVSVGEPNSVRWMAKLRDFSLPVMVLSSFFVLTLSVTRKLPAFEGFFFKRAKRLWAPMLGWTLIYALIVSFLYPPIFDIPPAEMPPLAVYLTGYRHLWYLQFLFLGSLLIYPLLRSIARSDSRRSASCVLLFACSILLFAVTRTPAALELLPEETDVSVRIFAEQVMYCLPLVPLAVAMGLARGSIDRAFRGKRVRILALVAVAATAIIHLAFESLPFSREAFAIAVFVAALQPFRWAAVRHLEPFASASYGIYILHFLPVQVIWILGVLKGFNFDGLSVVVLSAGIYLTCFGIVRFASRLPLVELLLPGVRTSLQTLPQASGPIPLQTEPREFPVRLGAALPGGVELRLRENAVEHR